MKRFALWSCLLLGVASAVSCGDGDDATPSPSGTVTASTTVTTSQPTVTLDQALANFDELRATRPLSQTTLFYAYKEGRHVTVESRNVMTGHASLILEYDEPHEAQHDNNYWDELVPSVAIDPAGGYLVYASDPDVISYDLLSGASTTLLTGQPPDSVGRRRWLAPSGGELCCAYSLASPSVGPTGRAVLRMSQYEGGSMASFSVDGSDVCQVEVAGGGFGASGEASWNDAGIVATGNSGEYTTSGLFIIDADQPCLATPIGGDLPGAGFSDARWSPDGARIVASRQEDFDPSSDFSLAIVYLDGSPSLRPVLDGLNFSPLFSPDGNRVYFARSDSTKADGTAANWGVWAVDPASGLIQEILPLPTGWSAKPSGWTNEGYLILKMTYGCDYYASCGSRLAVVYPKNGDLIYLSAKRDFTNFLGFAP